MKNETARKQPAQHTPWRIDPHSGYDLRTDGQVVDAEGMQVLSYGRLVHCISPEHANTIVTAVNQHDTLLASHKALVEALEAAMPHVRYKNQTSHILRTDVDLVLDKMEMALAQAKQVKA